MSSLLILLWRKRGADRCRVALAVVTAGALVVNSLCLLFSILAILLLLGFVGTVSTSSNLELIGTSCNNALLNLRYVMPESRIDKLKQIQLDNPNAPNSPVYIVSDPAYAAASDLTGGAQGVSFPQGMKAGDMLRSLTSSVGRQALLDVLRGKDPAIVPQKAAWGPVQQHEMGHQATGEAPSKLDPAAVQALLPAQGWQNLIGQPGIEAPLADTRQPGPYGYSPENAMFEVAARLAAEPESLGLTTKTRIPVIRRYRALLKNASPEAAAQYDKYLTSLGISTK
jgi:hypothetical protein